jgi:threonine dehydratase
VPAPSPVTLADVEAAAAAIAGAVLRTPSAPSQTLSALTGAEVVVKFENLQFTASYKERGALTKLLSLTPEQRARGVVAMSAGNHAQALAFHGRRLGVDVTIVMPRHAPFTKVAATEALGACVVRAGDDLGGAAAEAARIMEAEGRTWVPPFDDPLVVAGQGTVALELLADHPELEVLVVPVGGGGLIAGMAVAARGLEPALGRRLEVVGVQAERYPSMVNALDGGDRPVGGPTLAEGIAVPRAGELTAALARALVDDVVTVGEADLERAVTLFLEYEKVVAEGAGAAGLAALLAHGDRFRGRRVGLVLTGGNIDLRTLATVIMRGLVHSGRLSRLAVEMRDVPGELARLSAAIADAGGNIVEVAHQRLFSDLSITSTVLEVAVESRDAAHAAELVAALRAAGLAVRSLPAV